MCWHLLFPERPCLLLAHPCPCLPGSAASHYSCSRPCAPPASLLSLFHTLGILLPCSHIPAEPCCSQGTQHLTPLKSLTNPNIYWCYQLKIYPGLRRWIDSEALNFRAIKSFCTRKTEQHSHVGWWSSDTFFLEASVCPSLKEQKDSCLPFAGIPPQASAVTLPGQGSRGKPEWLFLCSPHKSPWDTLLK